MNLQEVRSLTDSLKVLTINNVIFDADTFKIDIKNHIQQYIVEGPPEEVDAKLLEYLDGFKLLDAI